MTPVDGAPGGLERALGLLEPRWRRRSERMPEGYLDLLGDAAPAPAGRAQRLMLTRAVPAVYERWWRPALGRLAKGVAGPGMREERRLARAQLALVSGHVALDIGCGTGAFTRDFATLVGPDGLVVGIDASPTMLARAVAATPDGNVAYLRADAERLPFRAAAFDAVCCFAALHLFADPWAALDEMARVLAPGGRLALLTSRRPRRAPLSALGAALGAGLGVRVFDADELAQGLARRGFDCVRRQGFGLAQLVGARKAPSAAERSDRSRRAPCPG